MAEKRRTRLGWATGIGFSLLSLLNISCTPGCIPENEMSCAKQEIKSKPYCAGFEGLQPFSGNSMKIASDYIAKELNIPFCTTSGNCSAHMPLIREAYKNNQPIVVAGFSMGEEEAKNLANLCNKEGIKVDLLVLIDGPFKGKIPENVMHVVDITGAQPYIFRRVGRYSKEDLKNPNTNISYAEFNAEHLGVPNSAKEYILSQIKENLNGRLAQK